jgi:hypothetical protein
MASWHLLVEETSIVSGRCLQANNLIVSSDRLIRAALALSLFRYSSYSNKLIIIIIIIIIINTREPPVAQLAKAPLCYHGVGGSNPTSSHGFSCLL